VLNNQLYFSGFDYTNGSELWVTGGTAGSTHIVKKLRADGGCILNGGNPVI
jgi:ELWxxDGT repeat protein